MRDRAAVSTAATIHPIKPIETLGGYLDLAVRIRGVSRWSGRLSMVQSV